MCFGRWDTPQHVLVDDPDASDLQVGEQVWPGKHYSNGRVADFHNLKKPEEDMYDRSKVPRMPWHDVGMQVVRQPARDLAHHFVERWNYLLRIKNHSCVMPCLLPPPEFKASELSSMGLTGTCEVQIVRSAGFWSLGTPDRIEQSIQNTYLKVIQLSEHFVYIENQFFITSTVLDGVKVENKIGDVIIHRAIGAHQEGTPWRCCIVIPLLPGYPSPINHGDANSLRIIIEFQNRTICRGPNSICRGPNSIFGRLRKEGIDLSDYISVFSLRSWAKLRGNVLTTEQVYVHAKICIVDDRLAIIGSANINERSQRGDRDSEVAAVIRDTDMIDGTMAGKPFRVGWFAHSLQVRLMWEHLGVDVDSMYEEDLMDVKPWKPANGQSPRDPDREAGGKHDVVHSEETKGGSGVSRAVRQAVPVVEHVMDTDAGEPPHQAMEEGNRQEPSEFGTCDGSSEKGRTVRSRDHEKDHRFRSSTVPAVEENAVVESLDSFPEDSGTSEEGPDRAPEPQGGDAQESQGHSGPAVSKNQDVKANGDVEVSEKKRDQGGVETPRTTDLFRDLLVPPATFEARVENGEQKAPPTDPPKNSKADDQHPHVVFGKNDAIRTEREAVRPRTEVKEHPSTKLNPRSWTLPMSTPTVNPRGFEDPISDEFWERVWMACTIHNTGIYRKVFHTVPDDLVTTWKQYKDFVLHHERLNKPAKDGNGDVGRVPSKAGDEQAPDFHKPTENPEQTQDRGELGVDNGCGRGNLDCRPSATNAAGDKEKERERRRSIRPDQEPFEAWEREEMERLLGELRGYLVIYPTRFLEGEDIANNFLFNADRLLPFQIYA